MDIMNVYVIADSRKFDKDAIVKIIAEEGYKHNFFFGCTLCNTDVNVVSAMNTADEVWCFGDVEGHFEYGHAKKIGKDIWRMG